MRETIFTYIVGSAIVIDSITTYERSTQRLIQNMEAAYFLYENTRVTQISYGTKHILVNKFTPPRLFQDRIKSNDIEYLEAKQPVQEKRT